LGNCLGTVNEKLFTIYSDQFKDVKGQYNEERMGVKIIILNTKVFYL